jgi:hypothetical protein
MKTNYALTILLTLLFLACGKKTQVKGVVYSKNNIPVPNVSVGYHEYRESSYPEHSNYEAATTNDKGEYQLDFRGRKKFRYEVFCNSDSGSKYKRVSVGATNTEDLHLQ